MSRIRVLPEQISNKIAAGEVIERPASVVKELVENAIDAGATRITVSVEKAGAKLVAVADNGCGMDSDDALLCLEAHATSKIKTEDDIHAIRTMGFRGEALPSIASVSRFTLRTREKSSREGAEVVVEAGKFVRNAPVGCAVGTEIIVRDLFFNIPARKKFMKSQATEEKHIYETVFLLALPNPHIAFELVVDGKTAFTSAAHSDIRPRLQTFFGYSADRDMLPLERSSGQVKVSGFVGRPSTARNSRREQRVFVNARAVETQPAYRGLKDAFGTLVDKGRFPPAVVFLSMPHELVDVNVHPAKREIRFRNDREVEDAVAAAVRQALSLDNPFVPGAAAAAEPEVRDAAQVPTDFGQPFTRLDAADCEPATPPPELANILRGSEVFYKPAQADVRAVPASDFFARQQAAAPREETPGSDEKRPSFPGLGELDVLGAVDNTYICGACKTGLLLIDQHAAHERILFERILADSKNGAAVQKLLLPATIEMSRAEAAYLSKNLEPFRRTGFDIEPFGENTFVVGSTPAGFRVENITSLVRDILDELLEGDKPARIEDFAAVAKAACSAAVKADDKLHQMEAASLIEQLAKCEMPYACPHGRPTVIMLTLKELHKRFGRT